ncbi:hypothetical protein [Vibrio lamellibrachiae]|uniref:hypothetical protein n=1 Tax=Vibrio lamellibrachiae TaxID=2910253 RepID=UPI003D11BA09
MTLFCIGVIQSVIGVEFTDSSITIPWLPKIEFLHPEKLFYLYQALIAYAVFRYYLHSQPTRREINSSALKHSFTQTAIGKWFVRKHIVGNNTFFNVTDADMTNRGENVVGFRIQLFDEPDSAPTDFFTLIYSNSSNVNQIEIEQHLALGGGFEARKDEGLNFSWGIFYNDGVDEHYESFRTSTPPTSLMQTKLKLLTLYSTLTLVVKNPGTFDFLVPLFLNIGLLTYTVMPILKSLSLAYFS